MLRRRLVAYRLQVSTQLSPGRRTDLAILRLEGAIVSEREDHLVVRSPNNPGFHWGNFVLVTTGDGSDADRWLSIFAQEFPDARHVAIDLPRMPDPAGYAAHGVAIVTDDVLVSRSLPTRPPLPQGYVARILGTDDDWEQLIQRNIQENLDTGEHEPAGYECFTRDQAMARRELVSAGHAAFFGAFAGADLVADLGIVVLGDTARYQSVGTAYHHRRKGLAGHLLGAAAAWAAERGVHEWVIVTGSTNPAGRLYRSLGFGEAAQNVQAYWALPPNSPG